MKESGVFFGIKYYIMIIYCDKKCSGLTVTWQTSAELPLYYMGAFPQLCSCMCPLPQDIIKGQDHLQRSTLQLHPQGPGSHSSSWRMEPPLLTSKGKIHIYIYVPYWDKWKITNADKGSQSADSMMIQQWNLSVDTAASLKTPDLGQNASIRRCFTSWSLAGFKSINHSTQRGVSGRCHTVSSLYWMHLLLPWRWRQ